MPTRHGCQAEGEPQGSVTFKPCDQHELLPRKYHETLKSERHKEPHSCPHNRQTWETLAPPALSTNVTQCHTRHRRSPETGKSARLEGDTETCVTRRAPPWRAFTHWPQSKDNDGGSSPAAAGRGLRGHKGRIPGNDLPTGAGACVQGTQLVS